MNNKVEIVKAIDLALRQNPVGFWKKVSNIIIDEQLDLPMALITQLLENRRFSELMKSIFGIDMDDDNFYFNVYEYFSENHIDLYGMVAKYTKNPKIIVECFASVVNEFV